MLVTAILLGSILTGCSGGRKLNPTEYVTLDVSGLNGQGTGRVVLDGEAIIKVIEEKKDLTTRNREDLEALLKDAEKDFSMSESSGLSNGDTVTVKSDMEKKVLKEYGIVIENGSVDLTVEGLIDLTEISLNDYMSVVFSGFEGYGNADVSFDREAVRERVREIAASIAGAEAADSFVEEDLYAYLNSISFSQTYFGDLSEGEEITCTIGMEKSFIERYGIQFVFEDYSAKTEGLLPVTSVSMTDYLLLEAEGFDGHARASAYIDTDALSAELEKVFTEQGRGTYGPLEEGVSAADEAASAARYIRDQFGYRFEKTLDQSEGLREGDKVTCDTVLRQDEDAYIGNGFTLEGGKKEFEITGLTPTVEINISEYALAGFTGFDGHGSASVELDYDAMKQYLEEQFKALGRGATSLASAGTDHAQEADAVFSDVRSMVRYNYTSGLSADEGLANGDVITASWNLDEGERDYYEYGGIYILGGTKEMTVEGLVPTVDFNICEHITSQFTGYNGAGSVSVWIDEEAVAAFLKEQFEELGRGAYAAASPDTDFDTEAANAADLLCDRIDYYYTLEYPAESRQLANGEQINVSYRIDEDVDSYYERLGMNVYGGSVDVTVEGLEEPAQIDLADAVEVTFSGITPNVYVERVIDEEATYAGSTSLWDDYEKQIYAWNGDTYSFDITYNAQEMLEQGFVVTNTHVEETISGLNTYKLSAQSPDDETLAPLWEAFDDAAEAGLRREGSRILNSHEDPGWWIVWSDSKFVRERAQVQYVSTQEEGTKNALYLIYRYDVVEKKEDHSVQARPAWYVVQFSNVQETPDGELIYEYTNENVFFTEQELNDHLEQCRLGMSENASAQDLVYPEEAAIQPAGDEQVGGGAAALQAAAPGQADAAALSQAAKTIEWEGHTYARYDTVLTWKEAEVFCREAGGHLVTIRSDREAMVVRSLLEEAPMSPYFTGGTDEAYEGAWTWSDGEPFDYDGWDNGQPDNYRSGEYDEDYLALDRSYSGKFNDRPLNAEAGYIMEVDPVSEQEDFTWLTDMEASGLYNAGFQERVTDHYGTEHFGSLYLDASRNGAAFYDLNGEWERLTGTVSTFADAQSDALFEIVIWGDDQILFSRYAYRKTDAPMNIDLDLTGVQKLAVETFNRGGYSNGYLFLNDAKLTKAASAATGKKAGLKDLPLIGSSSVDVYTRTGLPTDAQGRVHRDAWLFHADQDARAAWQLDGNYMNFRCVVLGQDEGNSISSANVEILADGNVVWSAEDLSVIDGYQEVDLDVTGVMVLEIVTSNAGEYDRPMAFVADTFLSGEETQAGDEAAENAPAEDASEETAAEASQTQDASEETTAETSQTQDASDETEAGEKKEETVPAEDAGYLAAEEVLALAAQIVRSEGKEYYRFDEPVTERMALWFVQNAGGALADPLTDAEDAAFRKLMEKRIYSDYWLGRDDHEYSMNTDDSTVKTGFVMEMPDGEKTNALAGSTYLTDLEWTASESAEKTNVSRAPDFFPNSIWFNCGRKGYVLTDLNGRYDRLDTVLYQDSGNGTNSLLQVAVFGDGKLLGEVRNINRASSGTVLSIDVQGVNQLRICSVNTGEDERAEFFMATPRLYASSQPSPAKKTARLSDLTMVDGSEYEWDAHMMIDGYGKPSDLVQTFNADRNGYALYNLGGQYTSFSGRLTAGKETDLYDTARVTILVDGNEVFDSGMWKAADGPLAFEVDVTGASTLEFRTETADPENGRMYVYLADDRLAG